MPVNWGGWQGQVGGEILRRTICSYPAIRVNYVYLNLKT